MLLILNDHITEALEMDNFLIKTFIEKNKKLKQIKFLL